LIFIYKTKSKICKNGFIFIYLPATVTRINSPPAGFKSSKAAKRKTLFQKNRFFLAHFARTQRSGEMVSKAAGYFEERQFCEVPG
jgi:hypothetical protein